MDLPVLGQKLPPAAIDIGGVIDASALQFGQGTAHHIDAQLRRGLGQGRLGGTARLLPIGPETAVVIGAAEHLRQNRHVRPVLRRLTDVLTGRGDILLFVRRDGHLDECDAHDETS